MFELPNQNTNNNFWFIPFLYIQNNYTFIVTPFITFKIPVGWSHKYIITLTLLFILLFILLKYIIMYLR